MRIATGALIAAAITLSGCARDNVLSGLNPFAASEDVRIDGPAAPPGGAIRRRDDRGVVQQVTSLTTRPLPGGLVLEARGLPPVQGYWDAGLVRVGRGPRDGVLLYELRIEPPLEPRRAGPTASREVVTAAYIPDAALRGVRAIRVRGLLGAREVRR